MSGLPVVSGRQTIAALERIGYEVVRRKGSHVRLRHADSGSRKPVTVPDHKELRAGTLRAILRDTALSIEDYRALV